jgi:hypothetical protein
MPDISDLTNAGAVAFLYFQGEKNTLKKKFSGMAKDWPVSKGN